MMMKKRIEADKIKKQWVDSGEHDKMVKLLQEKAKPSISASDLPF